MHPTHSVKNKRLPLPSPRWLTGILCLMLWGTFTPSFANTKRTETDAPGLLKEAERLWKEGVSIARKKQYQKALSKFWASYRLVPDSPKYNWLRGIIHFYIGRTYHKISKWTQARDHYRAYIKLQPKGPHRKQTEGWLKQLFPYIKATLTISGDNKIQCKIKHPGGQWEDQIPQQIVVESGTVQLSCSSEGFYTHTQTLKLSPKERRQLSISLKEMPKERTTPDLRWIGWMIGGVGLAGLGTAGVFGAIASSERQRADEFKEKKTPEGSEDYLRMGLQAQRSASIANVLYISGGVLTATGLVLHFLLGPRKILTQSANRQNRNETHVANRNKIRPTPYKGPHVSPSNLPMARAHRPLFGLYP